MDTAALTARFRRLSYSEHEIGELFGWIRTLEAWLQKAGSSPERAGARELRAYFRRLIRRDENSVERLLCFSAYFECAGNLPAFLYLEEMLAQSYELDDLFERITRFAGADTAEQIERDVPPPAIGTDPSLIPAYTARLLRRLFDTVPAQALSDVLAKSDPDFLPLSFEAERKLFSASGSMDEYLLASANLKLLRYRSLQKDDSIWRDLFFSESYLRALALNQELLSGVRRGGAVHVALEPCLPAFYQSAQSFPAKRYYACGDPLVRASLLRGRPAVSAVWCERCVGRCKNRFEYLLGRPLRAEIAECALLGDTLCRFRIFLSDAGKD